MVSHLIRSVGLLILTGTVSLAGAQGASTPPTDVAKAMADFSKAIGVHDLKTCVPTRSDPAVSVCHAVVIAGAGLQPFAVVCEEAPAAPTPTTKAAAAEAPGVTCALPVSLGQAAAPDQAAAPVK